MNTRGVGQPSQGSALATNVGTPTGTYGPDMNHGPLKNTHETTTKLFGPDCQINNIPKVKIQPLNKTVDERLH